MNVSSNKSAEYDQLDFYGGSYTAILPFLLFAGGVAWIALSGAPDEKGFWPVLVFALGLGLILSKDKKTFSETVIKGMSKPIVMIMISAWILASTIGILMSSTGFVEALIWLSSQFHLGNTGFIIASFVICCTVSLSTGSSFATILICGPLLYPAGGLLGCSLPLLAGTILGGATFGDFFAPISDTTIASALSQKAEIGPTVRSRIRIAIPAAMLALFVFITLALFSHNEVSRISPSLSGSPRGLPMLLLPAVIIGLFLRGKHLLHGLLLGLIFGIGLGLLTGLLPLEKILSLDTAQFTAKSIIIDGINRAAGISFFTILLMGLVATLIASGLVGKFVAFAEKHSSNTWQSETWISLATSLAVLVITHSIVAILMVAEFANKSGEKMNIPPIRRANIMSLVACTFPFILPYFIPVILMANTTKSGAEFGIASVGPLQSGMYNFMSWALLLMLLLTLFRKKLQNN